MFRLVLNSLAPSTQQAYVRAWQEFRKSGERWRPDEKGRVEDVVHFIMAMLERRQSRITIVGKLAGIAFWGKFFWGYTPFHWGIRTADLRRLGNRRREARCRETAIVIGVVEGRYEHSWGGGMCYDATESLLFKTLMSWMFFRAFRVSELLGSRTKAGVKWDYVVFRGATVDVRIKSSKMDQQGLGVQVVLATYPVSEICPVSLGRVLKQEGAAGEDVFRHRNGVKVSARQLLAVVRAGLKYVGQNASRFGTHFG
ncbi:hypothetical protein NDU88_001028 [Pleurodeles waltl]|uniref:Uncharacterized protein n=1 Tax=Pleurodeles waltl TaxID=8319 RepID=A0AAV7L8D1_PLEWA|nr:hypothetical protein NDU88_001028 [Pleurodeles waltl]